MIESDPTISVSHIFNILMDMLSWPRVLSSFNDLIMLIISLFLNLIKESLVFGFQEFYCFYLKMYIETQKIIEWLILLQNLIQSYYQLEVEI